MNKIENFERDFPSFGRNLPEGIDSAAIKMAGKGIASSIVSLLKSYGKPLPVDFVSRQLTQGLGRERAEVIARLRDLETSGTVLITNDTVHLADPF